jgi:hypothetical protein
VSDFVGEVRKSQDGNNVKDGERGGDGERLKFKYNLQEEEGVIEVGTGKYLVAGTVPAEVGLADERGFIQVIGGKEQGHGLFGAEINAVPKIPETKVNAQEEDYEKQRLFPHEEIITSAAGDRLSLSPDFSRKKSVTYDFLFGEFFLTFNQFFNFFCGLGGGAEGS